LECEQATLVVLGCGADVVYPNNAKEIFTSVLKAGGALLSEIPWGASPKRYAFIKRNRLIAALSMATLIVEAGIPSGTFSTADATLTLGRDLLVVPGSILSKQSAGCNHLIVQGAWPIIDDASFDAAIRDIYFVPSLLADSERLERMHALRGLNDVDGLDEQEPNSEQPLDDVQVAEQSDLTVAIMERIRVIPSYPDELVASCGVDVVEVIRQLSMLEFRGQVVRLMDGRYSANLK
jgi:DNA processing protein